MTLSLKVPDRYGYVILSTVLGSLFLVPNLMAVFMKEARRNLAWGIPFIPGNHRGAEYLSELQRGHQNILDSLPTVALAALIGGLRHPLLCTFYSALHAAECYLYLDCIYSSLGHKKNGEADKVAGYLTDWGVQGTGFYGTVSAAVSVAVEMLVCFD